MANPSTQSTGVLITQTLWNELVNDLITLTAGGFAVVLDGGGAVFSTDLYIDAGPVPYAGTIASLSFEGDQTGDLGLDIRKFTAASDAPGSSDSIFSAASDHMIFTCDRYFANASPQGTMTVAAGDWFRIAVESVVAITKGTVGIRITKSF